MLDKATARLFSLATNLTEVFVVSVLPAGPGASIDATFVNRDHVGVAVRRSRMALLSYFP
jgi:hypothetical protein